MLNCETCGNSINITDIVAKRCSICGKLVCRKCSQHDDYCDILLGRICNVCLGAGKDVRKELDDLEDKYDSDKSTLIVTWKLKVIK